MLERYSELVESSYQSKKLSQSCYESLIARKSEDLEEIEQNMMDLQYSLNHAEYFTLLGRIVKGAIYLEKPELNEVDKANGVKLYDKLVGQAHEYHRENPIEDRVRTKSA